MNDNNKVSEEELLLLEIVDCAPVTIWACTRDCKIVLWNKHAERLYGYSRNEVIGRRFIDIFVDPVERFQAEKDCHLVIDSDEKFKNFLAEDVNAKKQTIRMLTNCFRVFHPGLQEYVQVEVGLDIGDLGESEKQYRNLREMGIEMLTNSNRLLVVEKSNILSRLYSKFMAKNNILVQNMQHQERLARKIRNKIKSNEKAKSIKMQMEIDSAQLSADYYKLKDLVSNSTSIHDLDNLSEQIEDFTERQCAI